MTLAEVKATDPGELIIRLENRLNGLDPSDHAPNPRSTS